MHTITTLTGLAVFGAVFVAGLLVFLGIWTPGAWSSTSESFQRSFPKLWGGLVMLLGGIPVIGTLVRALLG
ncbi:hypothetical protein ACFYNO_24390 [Kitasatospora sp. NPDC006697]|uniref:hypothetical protein n=1 Tax=Kitasatospora sp. NPDC006697 TaxID=3364020 RepID=UPI003679B739